MSDIENKIKEIFGKRVDLSNVTLDTTLESLDIDSLDLVEAMMDLEEEFGVQFTNDEILTLKTVKDVVTLVESKK